jgi:protein tyrosine/serine phosphatase
MHRFIKIDGVHNFRDFGKYKTKSGAVVRDKMLFRSGQLSGLSDAGQKDFSELQIKTVVDLRRLNERNLQPNRIDPNICQIAGKSEIDDGVSLPPHLQYLKDEDITAQKTHKFMLETYRRLPFEEIHIDLFRKSFNALLIPNNQILIHCAAGKDRTGILCALILSILEVHEDDIMDDYLLTNKVHNLDELVERYAESISKRLDKKIDVESMRPLSIVKDEYLHNTYDEIKRNYGTIMNFLHSIGISSENISTIRNHLYEETKL